MKIIILFALAYICLIGGILWSIKRWGDHLNRDAIPGLDQPSCQDGAHGQEHTDTH